MKEATLIFPNQLFEDHPALSKKRPVILAEDFLFFRILPFHKQKLVLLRAAMKAYADHLENEGYDVTYLDSHLFQKRGDLCRLLAKKGIQQLHAADLTDDWLSRDLKIPCNFYKTPMFLCSEQELQEMKFSMAAFYRTQRKKWDILMEGDKPIGGKYSYDTENRKKLPKGLTPPTPYLPKPSPYVKEAIRYVEKEFPNAIGEVETFYYPVTFEEAKRSLQDFIQHRFALFGDYEDAICKEESFLYHSLLSAPLNIGLLTPIQVVKSALKAKVSLNSLEGFIRQVIGWREFMRGCYLMKGRTMRSANFFQHKRKLPKGFWDGTTGIEPIDQTIRKILKTGYCHHIERLMMLGNFLLLTETDPDAVYEWFMIYFIDAYDWVMVPNVYGMSQYADGGSMITKPYVSSSNYILKMSDYKKGEWCDLWDGLFWRFLKKHKTLFAKNPRTGALVQMLQKNHASISPKIALAEKAFIR